MTQTVNTRLTKEECRHLMELNDRFIYSACGHLNPDEESYVGYSQHEGVESQVEMAVKLRAKLLARLPGERFNRLSLVIDGTKPRFRSFDLRELFKEDSE